MPLTIDKYPDSLKALKGQLQEAFKNYPGTKSTILAQVLIERAQNFDLSRARDLGLNFKYKGIVRDPANPPFFEHGDLKKFDWADDPQAPLKSGEQWHKGRRASLTGQIYTFDAKGYPVNPFMNTGMAGRGVLGQFGPNHAVDNGILVLKDDVLYMVGITRKHDNDAPALSGGFAKFTTDYSFDRETELQSRVEEFFEEMVSGSVELLPEYEARIPKEMPADHEAADQIVTALKLQQVQDLDPGFLQRLKDHLRQGQECFAGPVLCDGRVTNTSWIESRLCWSMFDDAVWDEIKGDDKFGYRLCGGDDASSVVWHKYGADIVDKAYASHGAIMSFMAASFLLRAQEKGQVLAPSVYAQMDEAAAYLEKYKALPVPQPRRQSPGL